MFPQGLFYILSRKNGFALDVYDGQTKEDANIIVWPQKFEDSDNQLWSHEDGRLVNKKSGHVLDIRSSAFKKDKAIIQNKRKDKNQSQYWVFDQGFICSQEYPSMVFDIKGDSDKGGAQVLLYKRKDTDNLNQLWYLEPYHNIESSLNMATKSVPLHKKEGFGQPRLGYGAEVGVPPELKQLPKDIKVIGVGNNTAGPTPSKPLPNPAEQKSSYPEALAPSNMNYHAPTSTSSAPHAEPGYPPSQSQHYQQQPPTASQQQQPYQQQQQHQQPYQQQQQHQQYQQQHYPPPSNYPTPPSTSPSSYPPPPVSPSNYPPPSLPSTNYPPPSSSSMPGLPTAGVGGFYMPPSSESPSSQHMNFPAYPPAPPTEHAYPHYPPPQ